MLPEIEIVQGTHGKFLCFKTDDFISRQIRKKGAWGTTEAGIAMLMSEGFTRPTILDVGANLGAFSVPVARHLDRTGGIVHAFEPQRIIFQQLCGNLVLNQLENVYTHNIALGAAPGSVNVRKIDYHKTLNIGAASLVPEIQQVAQVAYLNTEFETMQIASIDSLGLGGGCAFIKIDVEGFESEVIKGAITFLENNAFPPIFFEEWRKGKFSGATDEVVARRQEETRALLSGMGYRFTKINTDVLAQHPKWNAKLAVAPRPDGTMDIFREQ
jgi:FkbM family methyltransferase